jgi:hypothetical protein
MIKGKWMTVFKFFTLSLNDLQGVWLFFFPKMTDPSRLVRSASENLE